MLSTGDDSSVTDTASSIGDSTWDLIDDGSVAASDDECYRISRQQTPVSDGHGEDNDVLDPAKAQSVFDTGLGDELSLQRLWPHGHYKSVKNVKVPSDGLPSQRTRQEQGLHETRDERATAVSQPDDSQVFEVIRFEEPTIHDSVFDDDGASTTAHVTLERFEGRRLEQVSSGLAIAADDVEYKMIGTVRQMMAHGLCQPDERYKILYVGPHALESTIIQKIGSALISRLRSHPNSKRSPRSTFSIVPVSGFGSPGSPEVVLVSSSGPQISVDHCLSAHIGKHQGEDALYLSLDSDETLCSAGNNPFRIDSSNYTLPDLGIIFIEERETSSIKNMRLLARSFMDRHCVPCLLISSRKLWTETSFYDTADVRLPHLCVEVLSSCWGEPRILARLPIDLASFVNIDAVQMSRSLAHVQLIKNAEVTDTPKMFTGSTRKHACSERVTRMTEDRYYDLSLDRGLLSGPSLLFVAGTFLCSVLAYLFLIQSASQIDSLHIPRSRSQLISPQGPVLANTSLVSSAKMTCSSLTTAVATSSFATPRVPSMRFPHLSPTIIQPTVTSMNRSERFVACVTDNRHIILQPPRWLNALKKPPALTLAISRGNESLDFDHTVFVNGTYILHLKQRDHHGTIDVTVWTSRKPLIKESFTLEFKNTWFNFLSFGLDKTVVIDRARSALNVNIIKLQHLLAPARLQARFMLRQVKEPYYRTTTKAATWLSSLTSERRQLVLGGWWESMNELLGISNRYRPRTVSSFMVPKRHAQQVLDGLLSASSLPRQWMQGCIGKVRGSTLLNAVGSFRSYRETHLIESQTLAVRLWWSIRGGPPSRPSEIHSRSYSRKGSAD